jgi:acyl-CoA synthetase (AMP-forming)/AMP-acid ligase II
VTERTAHTAARAQAVADVCTAGGPFEIVEEEVRGWRLPVFARRHRSLRELFVAGVERAPDAGYFTIDGRTTTFGEHRAVVGSVARALAEQHGIGAGDRVAILAANGPEWPALFWAVTSLGAIATACNGWWTTPELAAGLALTRPALLVGDARRLERYDGAAGVPVLELESGFAALASYAPGAPLPDVEIAEDDPALILFTSGTTGQAKGATISHRGLIGFVQATFCNAAVRARSDALAGEPPAPPPAGPAITLMTSPMFHVSGLMAGVILGLASGGRMVLRRGRFDAVDVLTLIERERVTAWSPIGGMGTRVVDHPRFAEFDVSSIRNMGFGGGPTSPAVRARLQAAFPGVGTNMGNGYGSSETVTSVSGISGKAYEEHPESAGWALPTIELAVFDERGVPVPDGAEGGIHVRSAYTMLGYWENPAATAAVFRPDGWLDTGDIGRFDDGRLVINSRARDLILRSGENIFPIEVEQRLDGHPAVAESAVVGVDHPVHGQEVKAIVVLEPGATLDEADLARFVGEALAPYKVPTVWEVREEPLPRNASGKVLKTVLLGEVDAPEHAE